VNRTSPEALRKNDVMRAFAEIPDPEIPVISLIDLGVVKDVRVVGSRVEVEFTPTFMGCPALDTMRAQMEDAIRRLGGEPDVRVVLDDSWSTDRITTEGREKLRTAGFAPPAPRSAGTPTLIQLERRGSFACPWCGSTDTRLDNVFGPTPCRSLRYCNACRQPFEQFKTI
jgi:ring-1,2-phenylacetyl-CoA epoxidase subunit PaaD